VLYHLHEYSTVVAVTDRRLVVGRKCNTQTHTVFWFVTLFRDAVRDHCSLNERTQKMRNSTVNIFIKEKCYYKKKLLSMAAGATAQSH
jgi:hypothetical protein